ncbi:MAG TPA: hypothetical protein VFB58_13935 [Chloroflexota bacterium]|nr:hypothetical protein [Chloroflexota bacterium]
MPAFTLPLSSPLDLSASLLPLGAAGDDLLERWDGNRLLRTVPVKGRLVAYRAVPQGTPEQPALQIQTEEDVPGLDAAIRGHFVPTPGGWQELLQRDPVLATLDRCLPGVRPLRQQNLFAALVRAVSAQQVNLRWAATTRARLADAFGDRHEVAGESVYSLSPAHIAALDPADIRALQFTTRKAEFIVGIAEEIAAGRLTRAMLTALPDEAVIARLTALRGIGRWTAEWVLARVLGRPVVVAGDLGVRKVVARAYLGREVASEAEVRQATAHWGEGALLAQTLLLHDAYGTM